MPDNRPRLNDYNVDLVNAERGDVPFATFVNTTLYLALGPYRVVPDEDAGEPGLFKVLGPEDDVMAVGLTRRRAHLHKSTLKALGDAYNAMTIAEGDLEDDPQHDDAYEAMERVGELYDTLVERYRPVENA